MTIRFLALILAGSLLVPVASAQPGGASASEAEQAVRATIGDLFEGIRAGDSGSVRSVFAKDAQVQAVERAEDSTAVQSRSADAFATAVGRPHDGVWDERVWDVEIRVDGPMATAWMQCAFYVGNELSHCGVNSMQFVRRDGDWRILDVTYTRRTDCDVPADVR